MAEPASTISALELLRQRALGAFAPVANAPLMHWNVEPPTVGFDPKAFGEENDLDPTGPEMEALSVNAHTRKEAIRLLDELNRTKHLNKVIAESSLPTQIITDPFVWAEVFGTLGVVGLVEAGARRALRGGLMATVVPKSRSIVNWSRNAVYSDLLTQGVSVQINALNELSKGEGADGVLKRAAFQQFVNTATAAAAGAGLRTAGIFYQNAKNVGANINFVNSVMKIIEDSEKVAENAAAARAVAIDKELKRTGDEWDVLHGQQKEIEAEVSKLSDDVIARAEAIKAAGDDSWKSDPQVKILLKKQRELKKKIKAIEADKGKIGEERVVLNDEVSASEIEPPVSVPVAAPLATEGRVVFGPVTPRFSPSPPPSGVEDPYGFTAQWFTNSPLYNMVPTAYKSVMNSNLPDAVKGIAYRIASTSSMTTNASAAGHVLGTSIHQRSGKYYARFGALMDVVSKNWGELNKHGNTTIAGIPVSNLRSMADSDPLAITMKKAADDANISRILGRTPDTPQHKAIIDAIDKMFRETDLDFGEVGLSSFLKDIGENLSKAERSLGRSDSLFHDITIRQTNRMRSHLNDISVVIKKLEDDLGNRGLTAKQRKYYDDLISTRKQYDDGLAAWDSAPDLDAKLAVLRGIDLSSKQDWFAQKLGAQIKELTDKVKVLEEIQATGKTLDAEPFWPRVFNKRAMEAEGDEFVSVVTKEIMNNPTYTYHVWDEATESMVSKNWVGMSEGEVRRRVESIRGEILDGAYDETAGQAIRGRLMRRKLGNVRNSQILKFINTDVREVSLGYLMTSGRKIEWAREFGYDVLDEATGKLKRIIPSLDEVKGKADADMVAAGVPQRLRDETLMNIDILHQRIVGTVREGPDTWDVQTAKVLQTATQTTYLGFASLAATADFANLLMDHELATLSKGLISMFDDYTLSMAGAELRLAGDGLEPLTGQMQTRYLESLTSNPFKNGFTDKLNSVYYKANLLEPITLTAKSMDALFRGHTLIDPMVKILNGEPISAWERKFLARYNIDDAMARRIAVMPFERTKTGLIMANTTAWTDEGAKDAFRTALRSGVMNRVIMGTPADKPMMMSGKVYIPMRVAKLVGMTEDPKMRGYAKMENGLLALPLTFYSFSLGALNNITANYAQGAVRNQTAHFAAAMFMGYQIYRVKTSPWQREKHSLLDKVIRSLDYSGMAAIHNDLFYRAIETANSLGFKPPISPRFKGGDPFDPLIGLGGAPADWTAGVLRSAKQMVSGEPGPGLKGLVYSTPYLGVVWLRGLRRNLADGLESMLDGK